MTVRASACAALGLAVTSTAMAQPDLRTISVSFVAAPQPIRIGACNRAVVRITNAGTSATTSFEVKITTMDSPESGTARSRLRSIASIVRNDTMSIMYDGVSAWGGTTLMQGSVDSKNQIAETNEQNNLGNGSGTADVYCSGFRVNDSTGTEGGMIVFTVRRDGSSTEALSVSYATQNGTATGGSSCLRNAPDFLQKTGVLNFAARETMKQVTVTLCSDQSIERAGETFKLVLSNPSFGARLTDAEGTGTINDKE